MTQGVKQIEDSEAGGVPGPGRAGPAGLGAVKVGFLTTMLMIPLSKLEPQAAHRNRRQTPSNLSAVLSKKC
ncbi:Attractin [Frankliniella fusca]|uniref:Attractin n=1 Tax=Frankliniella fusca TaxID=407009 RepID=A0AAE1GTQ0_9NEOP|nr:Attractin [Frankliniella fusca]